MIGFNPVKFYLPLLFFIASYAVAGEDPIVDHHDPITIDKTLTLQAVIDMTLEKYPDRLLNQALQEEAESLRQRGNSWVAGASSLSAFYLDDTLGDDTGYREITANFQIPLWNWNQRSAGQRIAEQAQLSADKYSTALKLQVAGLVRAALWDLALEKSRYQQAKAVLDISKKQLQKIQQRVDLGDLPRSDYLLAKSDYLQKRSLLTQAEAEMMHVRKNYASLTGITRLPESYQEPLSSIDSITGNHPALQAVNTLIERKRAEVDWIKRRGSGQPTLQLGMKSEREDRDGHNIESAGIGFSIPFGGGTFRAPQVTQANMELNQAKARREHLYRQLEKNLHEARHALQVNKAELAIAHELKDIAKKHLKMTKLSFSAGEINLLDLLKIEARTYKAIRHAKENEIQQQRNIAFYNQAVGVQP